MMTTSPLLTELIESALARATLLEQRNAVKCDTVRDEALRLTALESARQLREWARFASPVAA